MSVYFVRRKDKSFLLNIIAFVYTSQKHVYTNVQLVKAATNYISLFFNLLKSNENQLVNRHKITTFAKICKIWQL